MILRSQFTQAPEFPFVCYLEKQEQIPLVVELRGTFGNGGMLPIAHRRWICGMARQEVLKEAGEDVFRRCNGDYVAFRELDDQVLFRLKYQGQIVR
jgi:hypothetical protein